MALVIGATFALSANTFFKELQLQSPVPFGDVVDIYFAFSQKDFWGYILTPVNEHIIIFPRIIYLIDIYAFSGTNTFLTVVSLILSVGIVLVYIYAAKASLFDDWRNVLFFGCLILTAYVNGANTFDYFTGIMIQHWMANFCIVIFAWRFAKICESQSFQCSSLWLLTLIAFVAIFSSGGGIVILVTAVIVSVLFQFPKQYSIYFALLGILLSAVYLKLNSAGSSIDFSIFFASPTRSIRFYLSFLGSPYLRFLKWPADVSFWHYEKWKVLMIGAYIFLLGSGLVIHELFLERKQITRFSLFNIFVIIVVFIIGILACLTRLRFGVLEGTNAKYTCIVLLVWLSVFSLAIKVLRQYCHIQNNRVPVAWLSVYVVLLVTVLFAHYRELRAFDDWKQHLREGASQMFSGVYDSGNFWLHYDPEKYFQFSQDYLRPKNLTFFRHYPFNLGDLFVNYFQYDLQNNKSCGNFDSKELIKSKYGNGLRVQGWGLEPVQLVILVDQDRRIVGIAHNTRYRKDIAKAHSLSPSNRHGWYGTAAISDASQRVSAFGILNPSGTACLMGTL